MCPQGGPQGSFNARARVMKPACRLPVWLWYRVGMKRAVLLCSLAFAACGGNGPQMCAARHGSYTVRYHERPNGGCGPVPDTVFNADDPSAGSGCVWRVMSEVGCTSESSATCPTAQPGTSADITGHVDWSEDGREGHGVGTFTLTNAAGFICSSTYDLTYTKL